MPDPDSPENATFERRLAGTYTTQFEPMYRDAVGAACSEADGTHTSAARLVMLLAQRGAPWAEEVVQHILRRDPCIALKYASELLTMSGYTEVSVAAFDHIAFQLPVCEVRRQLWKTRRWELYGHRVPDSRFHVALLPWNGETGLT